MHRISHSARAFAVAHDGIPAFHAASILLTVIAAALLNTGAFAVLIAAHASLDIVKYRDVHAMPWGRSIVATFRESLLDLFFLSLALCFSLYLHHGQSIFALSGVVRLEAIFFQVFGIGLARLEVLMHQLWVFSDIRKHFHDVRDATGPWRRREILWLSGLVTAIAFITAAPFVMEPGAFMRVMMEQGVPWRI